MAETRPRVTRSTVPSSSMMPVNIPVHLALQQKIRPDLGDHSVFQREGRRRGVHAPALHRGLGRPHVHPPIQLEGIRYGVEHWRRNRNDCRCMGALFWQINDCWPVASWASIDCFGRWKALQYGAKRFFEPVLVSACEEGTKVELHITNETLVKIQGTLKWQLYHVDLGLIRQEKMICTVERLHSACIKVLDFTRELQQEEDYRRYYVAYSFVMEEKNIGGGTVIFKPAKHFEFRKPEIHCEKLDGTTYRIAAGQFCKFVEVSFQEDLLLSDNYFDLIPGVEKIVTTDRETREMPVIYSLYDSY